MADIDIAGPEHINDGPGLRVRWIAGKHKGDLLRSKADLGARIGNVIDLNEFGEGPGLGFVDIDAGRNDRTVDLFPGQ